jgi:hypothetical protein
MIERNSTKNNIPLELGQVPKILIVLISRFLCPHIIYTAI